MYLVTPSTGILKTVTLTALVCLALSACGGGDKKTPATQVVAKVNGEEISVHQLNFVLQRQPGLKPEQVNAAGKQVLESLINQELAVQKAKEAKLDRTPAVAQALQAAEREVLARAYTESVAGKAAKPTEEEAAAFYAANPALFSKRRIYSVTEFSVTATPEQMPTVRGTIQGATGAADLGAKLKAQGIAFGSTNATRTAETVPSAVLPQLAAASVGQAIVNERPGGAQVILLQQAQDAPVDLAKARPAIDRFLQVDRSRKAVEADMSAARKAAKIEYMGAYAGGPGAAASAPTTAEVAPPTLAPASAPDAAPADAAPASGAIDAMKGLSGLK